MDIVSLTESIIYNLLDFTLWLLATIVNIVLLPVNALFTTILPNIGDLISQFNESLILFSTGPFSFFYNLLPPITKSILAIWLSLLIGYFTIIWTYRGIVFLPKVIHKIKFW